jgi:hypothetical protein
MEAQLHSDDMVRQFSILPENEGENYHKPEGQGKEIARNMERTPLYGRHCKSVPALAINFAGGQKNIFQTFAI